MKRLRARSSKALLPALGAVAGSCALIALLAACGDSSTSGNPSGDPSCSSVLIPDSSDDGSSSGGSSVAPGRSSDDGSSPGGSSVVSDGSSEGGSSGSGEDSSDSSSSSSDEGTLVYGGQTYRTVVVGAQRWMAENLNYEYKVNDSTYGNWCYGDTAQYCTRYGRLYTWAAAMDSATTGCGLGKICAAATDGVARGICPDGWRLPSQADWETLLEAFDGDAGKRLKSSEGWYGDGNGDGSSGFAALPSGYRSDGGAFGLAGRNAYFWTSSEYYQYNAYGVNLYYVNAPVELNRSNKANGFAVRCVKN